MHGAADERAHTAGGDGWWEVWRLDVASDDGLGVAVQLACSPALGIASWWTHVLLPDRPGPVVVRDDDVRLPRVGLAVRADSLWGELVCETPFEHWAYGLEAFGVVLDDPAESLRGEIGTRLPVGLDLEWEVDPSCVDIRESGGAMRGYEQFGVVHGEVLLERSRAEVEAVGLRAHSWGVPRMDEPTVSYWRRGPDAAVIARAGEPRDARELGRFLVPVACAGARGVVTRRLWRFDGGNGWSTRYEPE